METSNKDFSHGTASAGKSQGILPGKKTGLQSELGNKNSSLNE